MKLNYKQNKELSNNINNYIETELNNLNDNIISNCLGIDLNLYEKLINNENELLSFKEIALIKKEIKKIVIELLENDINYKAYIINEININDKYFDKYFYSDFKEIPKKLLINYIDNINSNNIIQYDLMYNKLYIYNETEINNYLINLLFENDNNLNYYLDNYY